MRSGWDWISARHREDRGDETIRTAVMRGLGPSIPIEMAGTSPAMTPLLDCFAAPAAISAPK
jgi:hypothetical protein